VVVQTSSARNRTSILALGLVRARVGTLMQVNDDVKDAGTSILAAVTEYRQV
jgi:hypothetical protein